MSIEAMKQWLEELEGIHPGNMTPMAEESWKKVILSLRQAIEQASSVSSIQSDKTSDAEKQQPFGYLWPTGRHPEFRFTQQLRDGVEGTPVYTTPPTAPVQEPYGWVSQHTVKGPYEWQFNKELSGVYRDNAISILPVYTTPLNPLDSIKSSKTLDAQPQQAEKQEPVAWRFQSPVGGWAYGKEPPIGSKYAIEPLYTTPQPQREFVGLTDEERNTITRHHAYVDNIIKATEAKLKEKNT